MELSNVQGHKSIRRCALTHIRVRTLPLFRKTGLCFWKALVVPFCLAICYWSFKIRVSHWHNPHAVKVSGMMFMNHVVFQCFSDDLVWSCYVLQFFYAAQKSSLLRDCIPIPCTFSPWSDWQQPTCEGLCTRSRVVQARRNRKMESMGPFLKHPETHIFAPENGPGPGISSSNHWFSVAFVSMVQVARFEEWGGGFCWHFLWCCEGLQEPLEVILKPNARNVCRRLVPNQIEVRFFGVESTLRSCPVPPQGNHQQQICPENVRVKLSKHPQSTPKMSNKNPAFAPWSEREQWMWWALQWAFRNHHEMCSRLFEPTTLQGVREGVGSHPIIALSSAVRFNMINTSTSGEQNTLLDMLVKSPCQPCGWVNWIYLLRSSMHLISIFVDFLFMYLLLISILVLRWLQLSGVPLPDDGMEWLEWL